MSVGWHFMNLILGLDCCGIATVTVCPWPIGYRGRVQPWRSKFDSRVGRIHITVSIILIFWTFCERPMMGEVEGLIWLFGMPAMPQLKPWSARGITHQPAFMGNSYSHVFSFIHPVYEFSLKEMRAWGQSKILSCCLCVWCESKGLGGRGSTRFPRHFRHSRRYLRRFEL